MAYEYEVNDMSTISAKVDKIEIRGINRTKPDLLKKQFQKVVASNNIPDLFKNVSDSKKRLEALGIFKYVIAVVDIADSSLQTNKYKVVFEVEEKNLVSGRAGVTHSTLGTNCLSGIGRLDNIFGRAESAHFDLEFGSLHNVSKSVTLSKPLENNPDVVFSIGGVDGRWDHNWAKFIRSERSVFTDMSTLSRIGSHHFKFGTGRRDIEASDITAPWTTRSESGPTLKTNLSHTFERNTLSDRVFPDSGAMWQFIQEVSSISPGSFKDNTDVTSNSDDRSLQVKLETRLKKPFRLNDWLVSEVSFSTGLLHSLNGHPINIADRFFLGGPLELRGFKWRCVGPSQPLLGDSTPRGSDEPVPMCPVGADAFWQTGLHLYSPLPFFGTDEEIYPFASQFRLHGFCMAASTIASPITALSSCWSRRPGNNTAAAAAQGQEQQQQQSLSNVLLGQSRFVLGLGLAVRLAKFIRLELNYCLPVLHRHGDLLNSGLSFGFGVEHA